MPNSINNSFLYDFIKNWIQKPEKADDTSFNYFLDSNEVSIKFVITPDRRELKKFPLIDHEGEPWRIISGIYISKFAKTIVEKNRNIISGFLLDSTFRALPSFVTAITKLACH